LAVPQEQAVPRELRLPVVGGAGPGPVLRTRSQTRGNGIEFDVGADAVELPERANPVIEGFVLPEMLSRPRIKFASWAVTPFRPFIMRGTRILGEISKCT